MFLTDESIAELQAKARQVIASSRQSVRRYQDGIRVAGSSASGVGVV